MNSYQEYEKDLLYMKMFDRQLIFSTDECAFNAQFLHNIIKDGTVLRYLPPLGTLLFSVPSSHPDYELVKFELNRNKIPYEEKNNTLQIKLKPLNFTDQKLFERTKEHVILPYIENVMFYPAMVYYKKRLYAILHYKSSSSFEVSKRIISLQNAYDDIIGPGIFSIEEIGEVKPLSEFFLRYGVDLSNSFYMEIKGNFVGPVPEKENKEYYISWPYFDGKDYKILTFEIMTYMQEKYVQPFQDFVKKFISSGLPVLYFEGSQLENYRIYKLINFKDLLPFYMDLFRKLIDLGLDLEIVSYVEYQSTTQP